MNARQKRSLNHAARKLGIKIQLPTKSVVPVQNSGTSSKRQRRLRSARLRVWRYIGALATIVTIASAVLFFRFDVAVEPYSLPDPKLPFSQLFSVQNTSLFTIHELMPRCQVESMRDARGNTFHVGGLTKTQEFQPELAPNGKTTATCSIGGEHQWTELLVNILVQYKTPFGFRTCKAVAFKGVPGPNNTYVWAYNGTKTCKWFEYPTTYAH